MDAQSKITQLDERDLEETFSRSGGNGGQNVNKVSTRVVLRHIPTNITVVAQDSRSQAMNRQIARERLIEALNNRRQEARAAAVHAREKVRRQKRPKPQHVKNKILATKKKRSQVKQYRRERSSED